MEGGEKLRTATRVIHSWQSPDPNTGAVVPPIVTSATYAQKSPGNHKGFEYTRSHNPTRYALERMISALEGGTVPKEADPSCGGFAFASGLAATSTILELIDHGSRVVSMDDLYGGTRRLFSQVRSRTQGLKFDFVDMTSPEAFAEAMREDVRMVWVETPTNPMMKVVDLSAIAEIAKKINPDVLLACDNTFATPIGQRPFEHGFDLVMHSSTKYLNGHSDVVGGLVVARTIDLAQRLRFLQNAVGAVMGPFDAYQTLRGIKTLDVRMQRHHQNGQCIAAFLSEHPMVEQVIYPGLPSHPQYELCRRQMLGTGGMLTAFLKGGLVEARHFLERVRVFQLAESLGAVESLINHPAIMTHASVPPDVRARLGIHDNLVRLSIGIEDCDDLKEDLDQALRAMSRAAASEVPAEAVLMAG